MKYNSPQPGYVIIKVAEANTLSDIIHVVEKKPDTPREGEVVAVGEDCILKVGQDVMYASYAGEQIDDDHIMMAEAVNVLAILGEE
tara:strand:+ start:1035 stop:1292 length:258 start_codon:yes stop_codon:yes gene_type:complete